MNIGTLKVKRLPNEIGSDNGFITLICAIKLVYVELVKGKG